MATQVAQKRGKRVNENLASLLARRDAEGHDFPKHHAAVLPAKNSEMKVIDAKIPEE